jgi:hypothetical protein
MEGVCSYSNVCKMKMHASSLKKLCQLCLQTGYFLNNEQHVLTKYRVTITLKT